MTRRAEEGSTGVAVPDHAKLVAGLQSFIRDHGGTGSAVLNYLGRPGVRIVVISDDGPFTDALVADQAQAESVCAAAGLPIGAWDRETTGKITVSPADRRRMAGTGR